MKKPETIDLEKPSHRVVLLRAYHALLSRGSDEKEAKLGAAKYAMENWDELQRD